MARILVVEDDPAMTEGICDILELAGHDVYAAPDGREAIELIPQVAPDLILSDVMMPRMDGFEFYEAVRSNPAWVFIPFVFLTALGQNEAVSRGKWLGADDYLVKPVDPENLLSTVESRLARSEAISSAAAGELKRLTHLVSYVLGHELRSPLTWIKAYSELLLELQGGMDPEDLDHALRGIQSGSDRLTELVDDAVLLVRLDTGQVEEEFRLTAETEHALPARLARIVEPLRETVAEKNGTLELDVPEVLPPVRIAPRFLGTIVRHLVSNAVKFARPGTAPHVRVCARAVEDDTAVEIAVADNGVGIPRDQRARIFDPLIQIDRPLREQQGMGMGLPVARGLVELHGGEIDIESEPGAGTTVRFRLPVSERDDGL
jgi:signal transduction histidine kinase